MIEEPVLGRHLEEVVSEALRREVVSAEPSAAVWPEIRRRITAAGSGPAPAVRGRSGSPAWPALRAVAAGVVLLGLGLGLRSSSLVSHAPEGSETSVSILAPGQPRDGPTWDRLSARLVWLASRERAERGCCRVRGVLE